MHEVRARVRVRLRVRARARVRVRVRAQVRAAPVPTLHALVRSEAPQSTWRGDNQVTNRAAPGGVITLET